MTAFVTSPVDSGLLASLRAVRVKLCAFPHLDLPAGLPLREAVRIQVGMEEVDCALNILDHLAKIVKAGLK